MVDDKLNISTRAVSSIRPVSTSGHSRHPNFKLVLDKGIGNAQDEAGGGGRNRGELFLRPAVFKYVRMTRIVLLLDD